MCDKQEISGLIWHDDGFIPLPLMIQILSIIHNEIEVKDTYIFRNITKQKINFYTCILFFYIKIL